MTETNGDLDGKAAPDDGLAPYGSDARARLSAALRRLAEVVVGQRIPGAALDAASEAVEGVASSTEAAVSPGKLPRALPDPEKSPSDFFPASPVVGRCNPVAPPVETWTVDGVDCREIRGRAVLGYPYEGPPTCVHGGVIAAIFDELLGAANIVAGHPGMTGTLTVRYRRPTPLFSELTMEARYLRRERRKVTTWGGIFHGGELTAEAEGVFISTEPAQMLAIAESNAAGASADVMDQALREARQIARSTPSQ